MPSAPFGTRCCGNDSAWIQNSLSVPPLGAVAATACGSARLPTSALPPTVPSRPVAAAPCKNLRRSISLMAARFRAPTRSSAGDDDLPRHSEVQRALVPERLDLLERVAPRLPGGEDGAAEALEDHVVTGAVVIGPGDFR